MQLTIEHPVGLAALQSSLSPDELLIEYVLAEPHSYALAVTRESVTSYQLPSKATIETEADHYRGEIRKRKVDLPLGQKLFADLLGPAKEYTAKRDLIVVPDGSLHLLPFSALADHD